MSNIVNLKKEKNQPTFEPPSEVFRAFERGINSHLTSVVIIGRDVNGMCRVICSDEADKSLSLATRGQHKLAEYPFSGVTDL